MEKKDVVIKAQEWAIPGKLLWSEVIYILLLLACLVALTMAYSEVNDSYDKCNQEWADKLGVNLSEPIPAGSNPYTQKSVIEGLNLTNWEVNQK